MNKLLIVLLAVCLVSTHAFVKRDAPAPAVSDLQKQFTDLQNQLIELGKNLTNQTAAALNPENIKTELEKALAAAKEALDKLTPPSGDAKPAA